MKIYLFSFLLFLVLKSSGQGNQAAFVETFDNNDNAWPFIDAASGTNSLTISNGHLIMNANDAIQTYKDVGLQVEGDFAIYARMIFLEGTHSEYMGIRFMMSPDAEKYCSFVYSNDRGFLIATDNGKKRVIIRESKSSVIRGTDYNTLTVIRKAGICKFLINDKQVHEEKIKSYFGPMVSVMTNSNMKIQVDEIQVYDPVKGKAKTIPSTLVQSGPGDVSTMLAKMDNEKPADYKQFYDSFEKFAFPYDYSTVIDRAHDITPLPFVQKKYFAYELNQISNHTVSAIAHLAICPNGDAFLIATKYTINNQVVTRFDVETFDKSGNSLATKEVGSFVMEPKGYFKTLDFKITRDGNAIFIDATEIFYNKSRKKNAVSFNTELCNL
jgi:hypothetical protein